MMALHDLSPSALSQSRARGSICTDSMREFYQIIWPVGDALWIRVGECAGNTRGTGRVLRSVEATSVCKTTARTPVAVGSNLRTASGYVVPKRARHRPARAALLVHRPTARD